MNQTENDIAEPRYTLALAKADEVWKTLAKKKIPVQLNDIIKALGIKCTEGDLDSHGITMLHSDGFFHMAYKKDMSTERKRFTVAHEIGHIALEHISFTGESSQFSTNSQEKEANAFAGALLIPKTDLKTYMKGKDKTIEDIVNRYWVSRDSAVVAVKGNRLINKLYV